MGRISNVGGGYGSNPKGYYLRLAADGTWGLYAPNGQQRTPNGAELKTGKVDNVAEKQWHNVKLQFTGTAIKALIDGTEVASVTDATHSSGLAGLVTGGTGNARNSALFDDLIVNTVGGAKPAPTVFPASVMPIYRK